VLSVCCPSFFHSAPLEWTNEPNKAPTCIILVACWYLFAVSRFNKASCASNIPGILEATAAGNSGDWNCFAFNVQQQGEFTLPLLQTSDELLSLEVRILAEAASVTRGHNVHQHESLAILMCSSSTSMLQSNLPNICVYSSLFPSGCRSCSGMTHAAAQLWGTATRDGERQRALMRPPRQQ